MRLRVKCLARDTYGKLHDYWRLPWSLTLWEKLFSRPEASAHSFDYKDLLRSQSACKKLNCNAGRMKTQIFLECQ